MPLSSTGANLRPLTYIAKIANDNYQPYDHSLSQIAPFVATIDGGNRPIICIQPKIPLPLHQIYDSYISLLVKWVSFFFI